MKNSINNSIEIFFLFINVISRISSCLLLFMMIIFPMQYLENKVVLILLSLLNPAVNLVVNKVKLNLNSLVWILIYSSFGFFWAYLGFINSQIDSFGFLRVYGVWPILIYIIFQNFRDEAGLIALKHTLFASVIFILVLNFNSILESFGLPYLNTISNLDMSQVVGIHPGYVQLNSNSIGSLFFLVPFTFAYSIQKFILTKKQLEFVLYILLMILVLLTSRRMLVLLSIILTGVSLLYILFKTKMKFNYFKMTVLVSLFILITVLLFINFNIDFSELYQRLFFKGIYSLGVSYRITKTIDILNNIKWFSFLFGNGGGMVPFEIVYIKLISEVGLIGLAIYINLLIYPICMILMQKLDLSFKSILTSSIAFGSIGLILAMFSNPFESFDYIWILVLPIIMLDNRGKEK